MPGKMSGNKKGCVFCQHYSSDDLKMGKLYVHGNIAAHYYCLLFSSGLEQKGRPDKDGIVGFLPNDILHEIQRGKRLKCSFCKKTGATIGCCSLRCRKVFHLPCGQQMDALQQYFGSFSSFCSEHRPTQKIPFDELESTTECMICFSHIDCAGANHILFPPCCRNGLFHRRCIQKQAISSGCFFFRCPLCNNKDKFQEEMLHLGIYIPEQDASWELENNAFQELYARHSRCDVERCHCSNGRMRNDEDGLWQIVLCDVCGSQGCHVKCGNIGRDLSYECKECSAISKKVIEKSMGKKNPTEKLPAQNIRPEERIRDMSTATMSLQQFLEGQFVLCSAPLIIIESDDSEASDREVCKKYTAPRLPIDLNDSESFSATSEDSHDENADVFGHRTRVLRSRLKNLSAPKNNGLEMLPSTSELVSPGPSCSRPVQLLSNNKAKTNDIRKHFDKNAQTTISQISLPAVTETAKLELVMPGPSGAGAEHDLMTRVHSKFGTSKNDSDCVRLTRGRAQSESRAPFESVASDLPFSSKGKSSSVKRNDSDPAILNGVSGLLDGAGSSRLTRSRIPLSTQNWFHSTVGKSDSDTNGSYVSAVAQSVKPKKEVAILHTEQKQASHQLPRLGKPTRLSGPLSRRTRACQSGMRKDESQKSFLDLLSKAESQIGTANIQQKMCVMTFREDSQPTLH